VPSDSPTRDRCHPRRGAGRLHQPAGADGGEQHDHAGRAAEQRCVPGRDGL
ncbi:MAG: hypothetical protein AVDCRST_MAG40-3152, partial [uncultured Gemmatimonadaceae bacterium]